MTQYIVPCLPKMLSSLLFLIITQRTRTQKLRICLERGHKYLNV
jgi:hypothetical protein